MLVNITNALQAGNAVVSAHTIARLVDRSLRLADIAAACAVDAEVIEHYARPESDTRGASVLVLTWVAGRPVHIVVAYTVPVTIITVYRPDEGRFRAEWSEDFRTRLR